MDVKIAVQIPSVKRYSGCLLHCREEVKGGQTGHDLVLLGRKSFGDRRITNVGGGMLDDGEQWISGALRELGEETFDLYQIRSIVVEFLGRERIGARVHSRLYNVSVAGQLPSAELLAALNAKAAKALDLLAQLKADSATPLDKLKQVKKTTEFDCFYWAPLEALLEAARAYYRASEHGTKPADPVELAGVGVLEPSFCCLLASQVRKLE